MKEKPRRGRATGLDNHSGCECNRTPKDPAISGYCPPPQVANRGMNKKKGPAGTGTASKESPARETGPR